jgi:hypothetical protein
MGMDSYQYPIRSFGDLGYRLYGPWMRHLFNLLQAIQLLLNVGLLVISNGEALSQAAKFNLCFAICCLIWCLVGFFVGQIRTLQKLGWLANLAVWLNLICMFISMGGVSHYPPNYKAAAGAAGATLGDGSSVVPDDNGVYPPVQTSGGLPANGGGFAGQVNGVMSAIFAYGGSMIFPEFMAEMKRPKDFLTAMWAAQAFIYFWYMFYGLFIYGYQGQYVVSPSYLGVSQYSVQTAGNVFAMVSAIIAAALYGNIGIKGELYLLAQAGYWSCSTDISYDSHLQQHLRGMVQGPGADPCAGQDLLRCTHPDLLGHRLRCCCRYPQLHRSHRRRGGLLHPELHLHLPAPAVHRLLDEEERAARGRGLQPSHWRDHAARPRLQPHAPGLHGLPCLVERSQHPVCPGRADIVRTRCLWLHHGAQGRLRERFYQLLCVPQPAGWLDGPEMDSGHAMIP